MKKITTIICGLSLLLSGCSVAPTDWAGDFDFSQLDPETSFVPYQTVTNTLNDQTVNACTLPTDTDSATTRTTSIAAVNLIKQLFSGLYHNDVRSYCGTYMSVDENGEPIKLSGRIVLPADGKVSRVMVVSHFTIGRNDECPSITLPLECLFAAKGIAVIAPDYLGYGVTSYRVHPYLVADLTARNVVDMFNAAMPFLEYIGCKPKYDDIFLFGYSQGGATTVAVQQYLESHQPETKIRLNMAGSGPYDVATTYDVLIAQDKTDFPCAIPMLIQGLDVGCHLGLKYEEFFKPDMLKNYDKWINSKEYTMGQISTMIGTKKISDVLTEKARNKASEGTIDMYKAMLDNSLTYRFYPSAPVYMFHSFDDNVVPFENSALVRDRLMEMGFTNVTYNFGHYGGHTNGFIRFLFSMMDLLDKNGDFKR